MSDIDRLIEETLDHEDAELRRALGEEPGFIASAFGMLRGPGAWPRQYMFAAQGVMFFVSVWFAWAFFQAETVLEALRWGLPSAVLMLGALVVKTSMAAFLTEHRLVMEIRRLELRIERMRSSGQA
ncbi:hypothetical protein L2D00_01340 [Hyphomonadaceae bacterium BL14]|nr:hypothetical protein L2D00_01340 [Hyphomonadaceae bacterium BL14]